MNKKSNVLIIAPSMVPYTETWGGSQRMYYLANELVNQGFVSITVAPKFERNINLMDKEILYKSIFVEMKAINNSDNLLLNAGFNIFKRFTDKIRWKFIAIDKFFYSEPSCFEGKSYSKWVVQNKNKILSIIEENKIETVIISAPSFSLFLISNYIRKLKKQINIIFDYRDPWYLWNEKKNYAYLKEKRLLKNCDLLVCFSKPFQNMMCKEFHFDINKTAVICNGYSEKEWKEAQFFTNNDNKLILTFAGNLDLNDNINNYRNPNPIIDVVSQYSENQVELRIVGIDEELLTKLEIKNNVVFMKKVTHKESIELMIQSDVLINIHHTNDCSGRYIVSGKFYDYLRSGKYILNIGYNDNYTNEIIEKLECGFNCLNNRLAIKEIIDKLIVMKNNEKLFIDYEKNRNIINQYSRELQNKKYAKLIGEMTKRKLC